MAASVALIFDLNYFSNSEKLSHLSDVIDSVENGFRTGAWKLYSDQLSVVAFSLGARFGLFCAMSQLECDIF